MNPEVLKKILLSVESGEVSVDEATDRLKNLPFEDLGFAKVDHHRSLRRGFPEVVYGPGKSAEQTLAIVTRLEQSGAPVLVTKTDESTYSRIVERFPDSQWSPKARAVFLEPHEPEPTAGQKHHSNRTALSGTIAIASAGTTDIPVAEEAAVTAELMGCTVTRTYDVGVAGLHRLLANQQRLDAADVAVVVAGMDGALPSVVSGITAMPLVAVPTSVGYGASFGGLAALLTMLNACSPGIGVVNIDNGFGGGYLAALIARTGPQSGG